MLLWFFSCNVHIPLFSGCGRVLARPAQIAVWLKMTRIAECFGGESLIVRTPWRDGNVALPACTRLLRPVFFCFFVVGGGRGSLPYIPRLTLSSEVAYYSFGTTSFGVINHTTRGAEFRVLGLSRRVARHSLAFKSSQISLAVT